MVQALERMLVNHADIIRTIRTHTPESLEECADLVNMHLAVTGLLNELVNQVCLIKTVRELKGDNTY
jgi:hypothetical protein